jgi:hypothetical protein
MSKTQTPIQAIKQVIGGNPDETLIQLAKASLKDGAVRAGKTRDLVVVQMAIVEVMVDRHPEIQTALDAWETDLDDERNSLEVAVDWWHSWE